MARVLVIDDDQQVRDLLRRILERAGHTVVDAADGAAGTAVQRSRPADLIITDIFMPGQDGLETILELRRAFTGVRIIAISGGDHSGQMDLRKEALLLGASHALRKPFAPGELLAVVSETLGLPPGGGPPPKPTRGDAHRGPSGDG
jgi:DNA-binding response OmpR family regulator